MRCVCAIFNVENLAVVLVTLSRPSASGCPIHHHLRDSVILSFLSCFVVRGCFAVSAMYILNPFCVMSIILSAVGYFILQVTLCGAAPTYMYDATCMYVHVFLPLTCVGST